MVDTYLTGITQISATVTGEGVCSGEITASADNVLMPDTQPPFVSGGSTGGPFFNVTNGANVQIAVNVSDGGMNHYYLDYEVSGGSGLDYAEIYLNGELYAVTPCGEDSCDYSCVFSACYVVSHLEGGQSFSFTWDAVVVDKVGNRSNHGLPYLCAFSLGTDVPAPCQ